MQHTYGTAWYGMGWHCMHWMKFCERKCKSFNSWWWGLMLFAHTVCVLVCQLTSFVNCIYKMHVQAVCKRECGACRWLGCIFIHKMPLLFAGNRASYLLGAKLKYYLRIWIAVVHFIHKYTCHSTWKSLALSLFLVIVFMLFSRQTNKWMHEKAQHKVNSGLHLKIAF